MPAVKRAAESGDESGSVRMFMRVSARLAAARILRLFSAVADGRRFPKRHAAVFLGRGPPKKMLISTLRAQNNPLCSSSFRGPELGQKSRWGNA
jgi:hypothetical protein